MNRRGRRTPTWKSWQPADSERESHEIVSVEPSGPYTFAKQLRPEVRRGFETGEEGFGYYEGMAPPAAARMLGVARLRYAWWLGPRTSGRC